MYSMPAIPEAWLPYLKLYMKEMELIDGRFNNPRSDSVFRTFNRNKQHHSGTQRV